MNNTTYVSPKESAYCPECKFHPQQERTRNHAERLCSSGHTFTLKQSREAKVNDYGIGNCANCGATLTDADREAGRCTQCQTPLSEGGSDGIH